MTPVPSFVLQCCIVWETQDGQISIWRYFLIEASWVYNSKNPRSMKTRYGPGGIRNVPFAFLLYLARRNKLHRSRLRFPLPLDQLNLWSREEQSSLSFIERTLLDQCRLWSSRLESYGKIMVSSGFFQIDNSTRFWGKYFGYQFLFGSTMATISVGY